MLYTYTSIDPFLEQWKNENSIWFLLTSHSLSMVSNKIYVIYISMWTEQTKNTPKTQTYVMADCSTPTEAFIQQFECVYPCAVPFCFAHIQWEKSIQSTTIWLYSSHIYIYIHHIHVIESKRTKAMNESPTCMHICLGVRVCVCMWECECACKQWLATSMLNEYGSSYAFTCNVRSIESDTRRGNWNVSKMRGNVGVNF